VVIIMSIFFKWRPITTLLCILRSRVPVSPHKYSTHLSKNNTRFHAVFIRYAGRKNNPIIWTFKRIFIHEFISALLVPYSQILYIDTRIKSIRKIYVRKNEEITSRFERPLSIQRKRYYYYYYYYLFVSSIL